MAIFYLLIFYFTRKVFIARKKSTDDLYAIKILKKEDMIKKNMVSQALAEKKVMALSNTPFVVKLFYAFHSRNFLFLVIDILSREIY